MVENRLLLIFKGEKMAEKFEDGKSSQEEAKKKRAVIIADGSSSYEIAGDTRSTGWYSPSKYELPDGGTSKLENIDKIDDLAVFPDDPLNRIFHKIGKGEYEEMSDEEARPFVEASAAKLEKLGWKHNLRDSEFKSHSGVQSLRISLEKAFQRVLQKDV
ncbi:MAG: hypothetical protein Q7R89_04150 [bacterium]|nr:hypothetical protein [bacterium]